MARKMQADLDKKGLNKFKKDCYTPGISNSWSALKRKFLAGAYGKHI